MKKSFQGPVADTVHSRVSIPRVVVVFVFVFVFSFLVTQPQNVICEPGIDTSPCIESVSAQTIRKKAILLISCSTFGILITAVHWTKPFPLGIVNHC